MREQVPKIMIAFAQFHVMLNWPWPSMVGAIFLWGFCELLHIGLGACWVTASAASTSDG
jgi:hypothetical protein